MATRKVILTGISEWAKVFEQNRDKTGYKPTPEAQGTYEATDGACTIDVILDDDNFGKLKSSKSMKKGVVDAQGRGQKITFDRKFKTNNDWECGPPIVVKNDDAPWSYDEDGPIGNGSTVQVHLSVYDIPKYQNVGTRLEKVKVLEHVEYIQPQNDGDVPPSTKKPSKKTSEEVLF